MHQNSPSLIESLLNESIAGCKMLNDVLIHQVVDLDEEVLELCGQSLRKWRPKDGDNVCDVSLFQSIFSLEA